ncbi:MAG: EFR1 family ferrodoxin [Treponema sp.]|nr:EFR1 family ferrodoxin [Treponema sp.]
MTKIYYFSGTGNSLWSARKIAQVIGESSPETKCELFNIGIEEKKSEIKIEADTVIIIFPSFAYGLPHVVSRFVKKAEFKTQYIAGFTTYGSNPLGTLGVLQRILKKKTNCKIFFGKIPAVENYLAMFGTPDKDKIKLWTDMQKKATNEAARFVIEKKENIVNTFTPFSSFVSLLFTLGIKIFYKYYRVSDDCNGCGICEKICPVSSIRMENKRPVFTSTCEHCQGCVNICPAKAIQFARKKFGKEGYCHPEIQIKDLMR